MLMVIFGAGASYDSAQAFRPTYPGGGGGAQNIGVTAPRRIEEGPWRPPLTKDLFLDSHHAFSEIIRKYPKLTHILPRLREPAYGRSVEQVLEGIQSEGRDNPESLRELASVRFYLCELLQKVTEEWSLQTSGVTNFSPLIKDILRFNKPGDWVCLVTFNYDSLLERALRTFDFRDQEPEAFLDSHPALKLFKLHGSIEWCRLVDTPSGSRLTPQQLIEHADTIELSDKFVRANATDPRQMFTFAKPIFPAIAVPVQTKSGADFECPSRHLPYLMGLLPRVTKILIIGWQAKEAHFLGLLRSELPNLRRVMVVGENGTDAERIRKHFLSEIQCPLPAEVVGLGGFTDFIINQEGNSFFQG